MDYSPLNRLPSELRNEIYELALPETAFIAVDLEAGIVRVSQRHLLALRSICRQIRSETRGYLSSILDLYLRGDFYRPYSEHALRRGLTLLTPLNDSPSSLIFRSAYVQFRSPLLAPPEGFVSPQQWIDTQRFLRYAFHSATTVRTVLRFDPFDFLPPSDSVPPFEYHHLCVQSSWTEEEREREAHLRCTDLNLRSERYTVSHDELWNSIGERGRRYFHQAIDQVVRYNFWFRSLPGM